ncbi:hypothetical protein Bca4012_092742 [Brassica carinata]
MSMWIRSEIRKMVTTGLLNQIRNTQHSWRTRRRRSGVQRGARGARRVQQREMYGRSCGRRGITKMGGIRDWLPTTTTTTCRGGSIIMRHCKLKKYI